MKLVIQRAPNPQWLGRILTLIGIVVISCAGHNGLVAAQSEDAFQELRERMVREQIASTLWGRTPVTDKAVLEALRKVPRDRFVPAAIASLAYTDRPLPIGHGQTISQPYIVASMTQALNLEPNDVVLEVGTGSGYQAAVLAEIVKEVYTIEIVEALGKSAAALLKRLGYANVHVRVGDGYKGWKEHSPFDGIIVTAAPDHIPSPLLEQLKPGGRMIIPVGPQGGTQRLTLVQKRQDGTTTQRVLELVRFVPFTGEGVESVQK